MLEMEVVKAVGFYGSAKIVGSGPMRDIIKLLIDGDQMNNPYSLTETRVMAMRLMRMAGKVLFHLMDWGMSRIFSIDPFAFSVSERKVNIIMP
jgi:hypothetical protein